VPGESGEVAALLVQFRGWMGRSSPSAESLHSSVALLMDKPDAEFLLGSVGGGPPAGVCQLRFRQSVWRDAEDCWLEDLFVSREARGSGLGSALVEAALDHARGRGCRIVDLDVDEENGAAVALYEGLGFSASAKPGGGRSLLMRRTL
jgi:ribosomal protein S18 acetylase RimI-like enzyme